MPGIPAYQQLTADPVTTGERNALRQLLKNRRNALTDAQQQQAAAQLTTTAIALPAISRASTIAIYHSVGAELNTQPLINALQVAGKQLCLPVLHPFCPGHLLMLRYDTNTKLQQNRYAIPEPPLDVRNVVPLSRVDCLLTPLVGFDQQGNRLGMGGGFYDRTLAGWARGHYPKLNVIGLAHDCQRVESIPCQPWDIPLPCIITPTACWPSGGQSV